MPSFKDRLDRQWLVDIDVAAIKRVRDLSGINLGTVLQDGMKPLVELLSDPITFTNVVYCLCKPQADDKKISDEDFGRGLAGESLDDCITAFQDALIDFFPKRQGSILKMMIDKGSQLQAPLAKELERIVDREIEKTLTKVASGSPGL